MFSPEIVKSFNNVECEVFEFIMSNSLIVPYMTIRELASEVGVSTTTILRFINKVGYESYNEFKYAYKQLLKSDKHLERNYDFSEIIDCLKKFNSTYYKDKMNDALTLIGNSDNVAFIGVGNSGMICQYGARRFTSAGKFSVGINDPYLKLDTLNNKMLVIALSVSGETEQIIDMVTKCKQAGCKIIVITTTENCTLSRLSDVTIPYYINKNSTKFFDMTSQMPVVGIIENLATMCFRK